MTTKQPVPDKAALRVLLLGLAGRIPDDDLAGLRACLAVGDCDDVAYLLAAAAAPGG